MARKNFKDIDIYAGILQKNGQQWQQENGISANWRTPEQIDIQPVYTKEDLEKSVEQLCGNNSEVMVVLTGGEPTLQIKEDEPLFQNHFVAIETNGTNKVPYWVSWITISPKTDIHFTQFKNIPDEIKTVFEKKRIPYYNELKSLGGRLYLQPLEQNGKMNIQETLEYIKQNPQFKLSVQLHKLIGVR